MKALTLSLLGLSSFLLGAMPASAEQVYIACGKLGVRVADFDSASGELSVTREALSLEGAGFIALHPNKPVVYATCSTEGEKSERGAIGAFKILEGGVLELLNQSKTGSSGACHLSIDATEQVVFAASYGSGSVASFQVKEDGSLSEAASIIKHEGSSIVPGRQNAPHAHYMAAGPNNQFAYVPDLGIDKVLIYRFDEKSAELERSGAGVVAGGAGPRHMKFSKDGRFAYVLNELNLTVTTFRYNAKDGSLSELATVSVVPEGADTKKLSCAEIRVHPSGQFVYTSQRDLLTRKDKSEVGRNSLSVLRVTEKGDLERVQTLSAGVRIPRNFNLDPSGKWLLAGGQASNDIQVFSVDGDSGELTSHGEPVPCPGAPMCFVFRPAD